MKHSPLPQPPGCVLALALLALLAPPARVLAGEPASIEGIEALRIDVLDLEAAKRFYCEHLGFEVASRQDEPGGLILENGGVQAVLRKVTPRSGSGASDSVYLNFLVPDLDGFTRGLEAAGISAGEKQTSAIGHYRSLRDPSGNLLHVKQLFQPRGQDPRPRVFNVGIRVEDMKRAEAFYAGTLGFEVFSRDYYPPVLPFKKKGVVAFILTDREAPARRPPAPDQGPGIVLRLATSDLGALTERLETAGVRLAPAAGGRVEGKKAMLTDPDGNPLELVELASQASG